MTVQPTTGPSQLIKDRYQAVMMPNYAVPDLVVAKGDGCVVWDVDGNSYLDLIGGIAVSALGHNHPAIVAAVTGQVSKLAHISNLYAHEGQVALAEKLLGLLRDPREGILRELGHRSERGRPQASPAHSGAGPSLLRRRRARVPRAVHGLA